MILYINFSEDSEEHKTRVDKVTFEIEETGTYDMDINELNFGARLAWRNAPRCIGRIQWKKLQVKNACLSLINNLRHISFF